MPIREATPEEKQIEKIWRAKIKGRTDREWMRLLVSRIKNRNLRIQLGCVIWFTYFGGQTGNPKCVLKSYVEAYDVLIQFEKEELVQGLITIGFPVSVAERRITVPEPEGEDDDNETATVERRSRDSSNRSTPSGSGESDSGSGTDEDRSSMVLLPGLPDDLQSHTGPETEESRD
jgi:hypothetical protein